MRKLKFVPLFLIFSVFSNPVFSDVLDTCRSGDIVDCLKSLYLEMSQIFRPSGKEKQVREWMIALVEKANERYWSKTDYGLVKIKVDRAGNLILFIPATGKFAHRPLPSVALQTHLDMVLNRANVQLGEDITPNFINGIDAVETNGWLHSRDHQTTMGLDNAAGAVVNLVYALNPHLPAHVAIEGLHTVEEETTMNGAKNLNLNLLTARVLINLDGDDPGKFIHGCMSTDMILAKGSLETVEIPAGYRIYRVTLKGLLGGHSGIKIVEPRLNAIRGLAVAFNELRDSFRRGLSVISLRGGKLNVVSGVPVMNVIPDEAELVFAAPGEIPAENILRTMEMFVRDQAIRSVAENQRKVQISVLEDENSGASFMLSESKTNFFMNKLTLLRNGVLVWEDENNRTRVQTSSNLSYVNLVANDNGAAATIAYMLRSKSGENQRLYTLQNNGILRSRWTGLSIRNTSSTPPYQSNPKNYLAEIATSLGMSGYSTGGGLENAIFADHFTQIGGQMITIGAMRILDEHAPTETGKISSWRRGFMNSQRMLSKIAASREFTDVCVGVTGH